MTEQGKEIILEFLSGDMTFLYILDHETRNVGLVAVPAGYASEVDYNKKYTVDSLVQVKIFGEEGLYGLFGKGKTMRNGISARNFKFCKQDIFEHNKCKTVVTSLLNDKNHILEHVLIWYEGYQAVEIQSIFKNLSNEDVMLEMLSSFSIGGITPFEAGDTPNTLVLHRLRSRWADEGRLETTPIEDMQLEPSFSRVSVNSIRFGQVGSMPVREYFPFAAVEDIKRNISWGVQVAWAGSWQIELYRKDDALNISGGLADREFGHWMKRVKPGEQFTSPKAILSVGKGGIDEISQRLTSLHYRAWERQPPIEAELPIIFNEWCTTWGNVHANTVEKIAKSIENKGIKYLVIDAGWYDSMGNWNINAERFPEGLEKTTQRIRDKGMIPGIWFEFERCDKDSKAFSLIEHMLTLDGCVIKTNNAHFWDMRDPYTIEYLTEKVIRFLDKYNFGYLKIDYNAPLGIGCDGADSPGEGLRQHIEGVQDFFRKIRESLPDLIIENCSSGGHRLEPSMMEIAAMASFSDAHESLNIPVIAANLYRAIHPCQNQIWAVVRKGDSARRLYYSIASTFLGRMCFSGDIYDMDEGQWNIIDRGIDFYKKISPVIMRGVSYRYGTPVRSYRHLEGWQAVLRIAEDKTEAFAVIHTFSGDFAKEIRIRLPEKYEFELVNVYAENAADIDLDQNVLIIRVEGEFQAFAVRLKCTESKLNEKA
jgi:alpha-galactosidase